MFKNTINVALPKGRLGDSVYRLFEKAGYGCPSMAESDRKLIIECPESGVRYFLVKPSDVAVYVERGAADVGVAGGDVITEYRPDVYELLDLGIGKCRMAVAGKKNWSDDTSRILRVATKYPNVARSYYVGKGREIEVIKLNGSIELAPILGISDVIVDIVETGRTLAENGLCVYEEIFPVSARLIANKVSYKFKSAGISKLTGCLTEELP